MSKCRPNKLNANNEKIFESATQYTYIYVYIYIYIYIYHNGRGTDKSEGEGGQNHDFKGFGPKPVFFPESARKMYRENNIFGQTY